MHIHEGSSRSRFRHIRQPERALYAFSGWWNRPFKGLIRGSKTAVRLWMPALPDAAVNATDRRPPFMV
jgi:hypothetical protein